MGRSHALSGLSVGVLAAGALDHVPLPVRLLVIPTVAGAALLPDLDHPSATAARALGPITKWIARSINHMALELYHATRARGDPRGRRDGHRLVTHTIPGCLAFGAPGVVAHVVGVDLARSLGASLRLAGAIPAIWAAISVGICLGLLARTSPQVGALFTLSGTISALACELAYPAWWWVWPSAIVIGCLTHVAGDGCTVAGVPIYWPLTVETDKGPARWHMAAIPGIAFKTGGGDEGTERVVVVPILWCCLALSAMAATGVLGTVVGALWRVGLGWWA